ncbi:MAG: hypothetical protein ACLQUY_08270 [Ktedonobacterales bacterium]
MPYLTPGAFHNFNQDPFNRQPMMLPLPIVFEAGAQPKWEYHTVTLDPREEPPLDEARLNQLGQDGWLLAGIIGIPGGERVTRITYYFVRYA